MPLQKNTEKKEINYSCSVDLFVKVDLLKGREEVNMKKIAQTIIILGSILVIGTGCGKKKTEEKEQGQETTGQKVTSKDVVSKKDTVIDGEEVTEYTLKDGTALALPKGTDIDEADLRLPTEEEKSEAMKNGRGEYIQKSE